MNDVSRTPMPAMLPRLRRYGVVAAVAGLAAALAGLAVDDGAFFQGYLPAFVFWAGLSLGCLAALMLHHLVAAGWGFVTQRILEAGARTVVLMAILFVPLLFGLGTLYPWTHAGVVAASEVLRHKQAYLNVPFFVIRAVLYFAAWSAFALLLSRWSFRQDRHGDARYATRLRALSAGGLVATVLLVTFASVDWIMSLDPEWYSTIFGWLISVSQVLSALAFTVIVLGRLAAHPPLEAVVRKKHFHDYGNLIFAFVILWTYMMFMQYLIIWAGDLPEDIGWFVERQRPGWAWVAPFLVVFHFAVPFLLLLSRRTKRNVRFFSGLAVWLLAVHLLFVAWLVLPSYETTTVATYVAGVAAFVGIGGGWMATFATLLAGRPLLPGGDPRIEEALGAEVPS